MALDHALALTLGPQEGVLRFYQWRHPTLSLGRNEPAVGVWDPGALSGKGVEMVRRPTGGRAVLHHREVTYSVILPARAMEGPRHAYRRIHSGIVEGLRAHGVEALLKTESGRVPPPDAGPCFQEPAPGEVVVDGRKLVGSAQARVGSVVLQHGSVLLGGRQEEELSHLRFGGSGPNPPRKVGGIPSRSPGTVGGPVTLADVLGEAPDPAVVVDALLDGLGQVLPGWSDPRPVGGWGEIPPDAQALARDLLSRYESSQWTWHRTIPVHAGVPGSGMRWDAHGG
jgi:lipoate-protein ligase A